MGKPKQEGDQQPIDSVNQQPLLGGSSYYVQGFAEEVEKTEQSCLFILLCQMIHNGKDCEVPPGHLSWDLTLGAT